MEAIQQRATLFEAHEDSILAEELDFLTEGSNNDSLNQSFIQKAYRREHIYKQSNLKSTYTILNYIKSDIRKKKRSLCIGCSTVTLVVMFLTTLKSLIDIAPIAFLKVG